jgi:hypothetical protein
VIPRSPPLARQGTRPAAMAIPMPIVESAIADATRTTRKTANGTIDADNDDDFEYYEETGTQSVGGDALVEARSRRMARAAAAESMVAGAANLTTPPCSMRVPVSMASRRRRRRLRRRQRRRRLRLRRPLKLPPIRAEAHRSHARSRGTHALAPARLGRPFLPGKLMPALILLHTSARFGASPHCPQLPSHPNS